MKQIDKLILCSPYQQPDRHWTRDEETQEFYQKEGRRQAGYTVASKKDKTKGEFVPLELVNQIRERLAEWEADGRPGLTRMTEELLTHWEDNSQRQYPFFFCQLEAMRSIIFMLEAPERYKTGVNVESDGGDFVRWCSKMATGSGKTIVMAMLIAYNVLNKVSYPQDKRFSKYVLLVAPGLTVKSRLSVLQPTDEENYYDAFGVVPPTHKEKLRQGKIRIINWHMLQWETQDKLDKKAERGTLRSVDKRKFHELSDTAYARKVLEELHTVRNLLVINDEAHHAWRTAAESKQKRVAKEEVDNTVWIGGLDKLHRTVNILRCHDFSATPFAPTGKKASKLGLFHWTISDFGLNDAIEAGLVKTPRVVFRDDGKKAITKDKKYVSRLYHIYNDSEVKDDLNQKKVEPEVELPHLVRNAYDILGADWLQTQQEWKKEGHKIPPVMITVTNTTTTADRIKYFFDSGGCQIKELCNPETTLQIDSKVLGKIENEDDSLSGSKQEQAEQLRQTVDTVGKVGQPGEQIRNVISVSMLSEGWDAKNVTQIMGLRAFSSQLLCEQVIGRGLRRVSYEVDENGMLEPEYVNIFGVPFAFIPHEGGTAAPRPPRPKVQIEPSSNKADFAIEFPNVLRVNTIYRTELSLDYSQIKPIEISPDDTITETELGGVIESDVTPANIQEVDIKEFAEKYRRQFVIFRMASNIFQREQKSWTGNQQDFLAQLFQLTEEFLASDRIKITSDLFNRDQIRRDILITLNTGRIIQHFWSALKTQNAEEFAPVFDPDRPTRSTSDMPTWYTSKPTEWHEKSHINFTVFDSSWESNVAHILNKSDKVRAFVKNDHLGFKIGYQHRGVLRNFQPDYLVELTNGDKLILEVKGQDDDEQRAKRDFLNLWVLGVNQHSGHGKWHWAVAFHATEVHDILERYAEFPTEAFLPENTPKSDVITEKTLDEKRQTVAAYYQLPVDTLKKKDSFAGMLEEAVKHLVTTHMDEMLRALREAMPKNEDEEPLEDEALQEKIYELLDGLTPADPKKYEARVRALLGAYAKQLDRRSFSYLVSGEYLRDTLFAQQADDFSPYVLQLSRAAENELRRKLFTDFTNYIRTEHARPDTVYQFEMTDNKVKKFAQMVSNGWTNHTLGQMHHNLRLLERGGYLLQRSQLLQDFKSYISENYDADLYGKAFLEDLNDLSRNYRNKSAHTDILSLDDAERCKHLVRKVLKRFLGAAGA